VQLHADFVVLAGFLWKIPADFIHAFPQKMVNIHPALLPKYGGKGMYGMNVHKAVKENKETETGITIHFVNEHYDEGAIIFQVKTSLEPRDTPEDIAKKIHVLEYANFPRVIEEVILSDNREETIEKRQS
jgi:phosphoribosylglycinamide formyltransferase-1